MPADRGDIENQSCPDSFVFYLSLVYHVWFAARHLPDHGVLVEYQEIYFIRKGDS